MSHDADVDIVINLVYILRFSETVFVLVSFPSRFRSSVLALTIVPTVTISMWSTFYTLPPSLLHCVCSSVTALISTLIYS